jgi:hypothetical protein
MYSNMYRKNVCISANNVCPVKIRSKHSSNTLLSLLQIFTGQTLGVFCDRDKLVSKAALNCQNGQNKGRYCENELSFLVVLSLPNILRLLLFNDLNMLPLSL